tara:strand:- start:871 stop:987 length:117 start_codon:yes stop_codon:yes gene_type:complete
MFIPKLFQKVFIGGFCQGVGMFRKCTSTPLQQNAHIKE